jgi:hypothetical protein
MGAAPAIAFQTNLQSMNARPRRVRGRVWYVAALVAASSVIAAPALAQEAWNGRVRVSVNGLAQAVTPQLSQAITLTKNAEPAPVLASAPRATVPGFDVGGAVRLWRNMGASVAISYLTRAAGANITAQIPHPFYFDQPRAIAGTVSNVTHAELATHVDGAVLLPRERLEVMLFGGLSILRLSQDLVSDVTYADAYPFDTARFVDAAKTRAAGTKVGYNAGADVAWRLSPAWGIGGLVRYVHATARLTIDGRDAGTRDAGGLQVGGGLRVRF